MKSDLESLKEIFEKLGESRVDWTGLIINSEERSVELRINLGGYSKMCDREFWNRVCSIIQAYDEQAVSVSGSIEIGNANATSLPL